MLYRQTAVDICIGLILTVSHSPSQHIHRLRAQDCMHCNPFETLPLQTPADPSPRIDAGPDVVMG